MGKSLVYFVVDIADYLLRADLFRVQTVEFKIGSEMDILNRTLSAVRQFRES